MCFAIYAFDSIPCFPDRTWILHILDIVLRLVFCNHVLVVSRHSCDALNCCSCSLHPFSPKMEVRYPRSETEQGLLRYPRCIHRWKRQYWARLWRARPVAINVKEEEGCEGGEFGKEQRRRGRRRRDINYYDNNINNNKKDKKKNL